MKETPHVPTRMRWALFRFGVISPLLTSPPEAGDLTKVLDELSARPYQHPITHEPLRLGRSTLERWFYAAKNEPSQPVKALENKVHALAGKHPSVHEALRAAIEAQHSAHPGWSYKLHYDNLLALAEVQTGLTPVPSIAVIRRFMKGRGLTKQRLPRRRTCAEYDAAFVAREKRSYEVGHVHGLWHSDFHECSRGVVTEEGEWKKPVALAFLDDRSRVVCHMQWYLDEDAQSFVHGFSQAILKRGLPRKLLTDNGKPMTSYEVEEGCGRLSIDHETTLPYTPEQNGKQESFWGQVEGRLIAMLEGERELTLHKLNEATQAWVELEYHRSIHSQLGQTPLERLLEGPSVVRQSPTSDELRRVFRREVVRTQRRSDGTLTVRGVRFELPSLYRVLLRPVVRYARWDLSNIDLVDARTGTHLATLFPIDKLENANGMRRVIEPVDPDAVTAPSVQSGIAPLLTQLMREYAATGLPPAYVPDSRALRAPPECLDDSGDEAP